LQERQCSQGFGRDCYIGDLAGHADHKREVGKIQVVGRIVPWKFQAAHVLVGIVAVAVINVRITQGKDGLHERPGRDDRKDGERDMKRKMNCFLRAAQEKDDSEEAGAGGDQREHENQDATQILHAGLLSNVVRVSRDDCQPGQRQRASREAIPRGHNEGRTTYTCKTQ